MSEDTSILGTPSQVERLRFQLDLHGIFQMNSEKA